MAVITLSASPFEVSILRVASHAPALALGLVAGVWIDRLRRRPLLIWSDIARAVLLATVPLGFLGGFLRIEQLYVVALLVGGLGTLFEVAYRSYLPSLVEEEQLVEGNAKLSASGAIAEIGGFGIAGALVQWLTAPFAVLVDAASFAASAVSLVLIGRRERPPTATDARRSTWKDAQEGLRLVAGDPVLRAIAAARLVGEFSVAGIWASVLVLFILRDLGLEPWLMTATWAVGGASSFFGALLVNRVVQRFGAGRSMIGATFVYRFTPLFVPLAGGPLGLIVAFLVANQASDAAWVVHDVAETSLIQGTVPNQALGRVNASLLVLGQGAILGGTLVGGVLGELIGLRATMLIGSAGGLLAAFLLFASPLRSSRVYLQVT